MPVLRDISSVLVARSASTKAIAALATIVFAPQVAAHHPMGGTTPETFTQGLLSGFGHPVIGIDHLAFIIGVGLLSLLFASQGKRLLMPLLFIGATALGTAIHLQALTLPLAELVIALSVLSIGVVVLSGWRVPTLLAGGLFAFAGVFHGYAYGEAVVGAEATPLLAYLLGFAVIQYAIAVGAMTLVSRLGGVAEQGRALYQRIGGGVVAGVGFVFVLENLVGA